MVTVTAYWLTFVAVVMLINYVYIVPYIRDLSIMQDRKYGHWTQCSQNHHFFTSIIYLKIQYTLTVRIVNQLCCQCSCYWLAIFKRNGQLCNVHIQLPNVCGPAVLQASVLAEADHRLQLDPVPRHFQRMPHQLIGRVNNKHVKTTPITALHDNVEMQFASRLWHNENNWGAIKCMCVCTCVCMHTCACVTVQWNVTARVCDCCEYEFPLL